MPLKDFKNEVEFQFLHWIFICFWATNGFIWIYMSFEVKNVGFRYKDSSSFFVSFLVVEIYIYVWLMVCHLLFFKNKHFIKHMELSLWHFFFSCIFFNCILSTSWKIIYHNLSRIENILWWRTKVNNIHKHNVQSIYQEANFILIQIFIFLIFHSLIER